MRGELLTATRGTALLHTRHRGWIPWVGDLPVRKGGAILKLESKSARLSSVNKK